MTTDLNTLFRLTKAEIEPAGIHGTCPSSSLGNLQESAIQ